MKSYIHHIISAALLLGSGCSEDLLDKNPRDQISSENFWQSSADLEMALAACYSSLQNEMFSYGTPNWDALTDNAYGQHNYGSSQAIVQGDISPSTGGYILSVYNTCYRGIARLNVFLSQLAAYAGQDVDAAQKSVYEAEAKFLRGYYYYFLYFCYGAVPLVTEPLTLENQIQPKAPAGQVLQQSLADLDFAIANLEDVPYYENGGHAVKSSAEALKARALLYAAYDENGNPDPAVLEEIQALIASVQEAGYELAPNYEDVFRDATQEGNPEIIFSVKFLAPDNATPMDQWYGDWLVVSPLQNLVDAYECSDGLPWGVSPLTDPDNPQENRDPRLLKSIFFDHPVFDGTEHIPSNSRPTGYGVAKFLTPDLMPYGYSTQSQQDWVMLRYGELLLIYAEIQNELAGPDASVYSAVNEIRQRAGMPELPAGLSQDEMRSRIRHERRIELAFEGLRYYDLKRWRTAESVLNAVTDGILPYTFEERFYLWPLPQTEIDKSLGQLEQNPDY